MMPRIVVWNPHPKKAFTRDEVARKQAQAVRAAEDLQDDPALADQLAGLTVQEYAGRKGIQIANRTRKEVREMAPERVSVADLAEKVDVLTDKVTEVADAVSSLTAAGGDSLPAARPEKRATAKRETNPASRGLKNPSASGTRRLIRLAELRGQRDEILDGVGDARDALDEGDPDAAGDFLDDILDQYELEEDAENGGNGED